MLNFLLEEIAGLWTLSQPNRCDCR